jgi:hypothetical protein
MTHASRRRGAASPDCSTSVDPTGVDPAGVDADLLPGPTAGQLILRGRIATIAAIFLLLVAVFAALKLGPSGQLAVGIAAAVLCLAGFTLGQVWFWIGSTKRVAEAKTGYSTVVDEAGLELRHPRTLALLRERDEPVESGATRRMYDRFPKLRQ